MLGKTDAQEIAVQALLWIASDPERTGQFLGYTGADPGDLKARAAEPEFLGFVLDFILLDDTFVVDFCAANSLPPETPMQARACLPGGDLPNWT